jgi:hypothetical protein
VLITNPDMLNVSIIPSHAKFERVLRNLRSAARVSIYPYPTYITLSYITLSP